MTCPNCGATTHAGDNFCLRCGARLTPSETAPGSPITGATVAPPPMLSPYAPGPVESPYTARPATPVAPPPMLSPYAPGPVESPYAARPTAPVALPPAYLPPSATRSRNPALAAMAVGSAVVLLLLGVLAVWWVSTLARPSVSSVPASPPTVGGFQPTTAQDRAIVAAVEANNNAQVAALRHLDAQLLTGHMAGRALSDTLTMLDQLQNQGVYQVAHLIHIDYSAPQYLSADQATIRTVEQWESTIYRQDTNQAVQQQAPQTLHEVYHLTLTDGQWIVDQVDIAEDQQGTPGPTQ